MDPKDVQATVCEVLEEIQTSLGGECPPLDEKTVPLKALSELDSPISFGATGMIGKRLGIEIPPKLNLFGNDSGKHSIGKTVGILCKLLAEKTDDESVAS